MKLWLCDHWKNCELYCEVLKFNSLLLLINYIILSKALRGFENCLVYVPLLQNQISLGLNLDIFALTFGNDSTLISSSTDCFSRVVVRIKGLIYHMKRTASTPQGHARLSTSIKLFLLLSLLTRFTHKWGISNSQITEKMLKYF